ncbi:VOC family protein [Rhodopseudomonas sp. P2A-2r]|uniref:VOC family protein n=1 Tax=Rhodopseudomonas sp. P2A-2r TaxID=2991972 RepID=UPI0022343984|nr:VOC family protein [Rhodopseudomonas sp. P2A-2r]UZE51389.1 VOC family protein [Rhodopseudomonas sp. P2A-2r]
MLTPAFTLLYVDSPKASAGFYATLLGRAPVETSDTFVMFVGDTGPILALWARHAVLPAATPVGGIEIVFALESRAAVEACYADWTSRGLPMVQDLTTLDFGRTFVAADPDGHRLRVCAPDRD